MKAAVPEAPGLVLRAARERAGLSLADVATRLRMGVRQLEALERGDYGALPTGTFLRGFVRNYAKAVNVDSEHAIRLLEQNNAEAARLKASTIVVPSQDIHIRTGGSALATPKGRMASYALVAVLLAGAVWYWWQYVRPNLAAGGRPASPVAAPRSVRPAVVPPTPVDQAPVGEVGGANSIQTGPAQVEMFPPQTSALPPIAAPAKTAPQPEPAKPAELAKPVAAPLPRTGNVGKGDHVLGFTFSGDCWVEVSDADGRILLSRQYHEGDVGEVRGTPPLSVVFGNAQMARLAYNGKEIELAPYTRISVARVTVK